MIDRPISTIFRLHCEIIMPNITVLHFDDQVYFNIMHIIGYIQLPVNLFGLYCIMYKSPKETRYYYKCLLVKYQIL